MIVVDASAIVAIMAGEPEGRELSRRLDGVPPILAARFVSTVSIWETACAVARIWRCDRDAGFEAVDAFLTEAHVDPVAPDMTITMLAVRAAERYGLGAGRPGILNLGDCFSYATAKHLGASLLYKGDDFSRTDLAAG
ncbi:type II toxin-antitoxin system VapC family toxin [Enterovirga rhinocerotis]|uniref:Ribonuclease VapC n=1 Tax=Enterovirga rhinocerotis TaxID=1339210 RepID=A0A4R7BPZ4_9HYPH|nr:type II toxin-antitoxin system VapC family toxin [Enterovirga rhinocerotis]TDR87213.1 ribonuclease VapC [Enterovirga rhinocerotis]